MGVVHKIDDILADIDLPLGLNMTNGATLFAGGEDSLGKLAKLINSYFDHFRPALLHDVKPGDRAWVTTSTSYEVLGYYTLPMFSSGVGGDDEAVGRQGVTGEIRGFLNDASAMGWVSVDDNRVVYDVILFEEFSGAPTNFVAQENGLLYDGYESQRITVKGSVSAADTLTIEDLRMSWLPQAKTMAYLLDGPYGSAAGSGGIIHEFLPSDITHLETAYRSGHVEGVRRILTNLYELIRRRTPQPIVTWADEINPRGISTNDAAILCSLPTRQLPYLHSIEVHCRYTSPAGPLTVSIDDWSADLPRTASGHIAWGSAIIQVPVLTHANSNDRFFQLKILGPQEVSIYSLCAWWRPI